MSPQATIDYDTDDDGLIEVDTLAKLDAIRYDLDGDNVADTVYQSDGTTVDQTATTDNATAYAAAFPSVGVPGIPGYSCGSSNCEGYELTTDLTFGAWDSTNPYWNGGDRWDPIGTTNDPFYRHLRRARPCDLQPRHKSWLHQRRRPVRPRRQ